MIMIALGDDHSKHEMIRDFLRSVSYSATSKDVYEISKDNIPEDLIEEFSSTIKFSDSQHDNIEVLITIPSDSLILNNSWDKYIRYDLEHDIYLSPEEIIKRFSLFTRRAEDIRKEIKTQYFNKKEQ